jgi:hypothetical protein
MKSQGYLGVTFICYDSINEKAIKITIVLKVNLTLSLIQKELKRLAEENGYTYIGLYDLFVTGGMPKSKQFIGRSTFYSISSLSKAKHLFNDQKTKYRITKSYYLFKAMYYHNESGNTSALIVYVLFDMRKNTLFHVENYITSTYFLTKIKRNSSDISSIRAITYLGIIDALSINSYIGKNMIFENEYAEITQRKAKTIIIKSSKAMKKIKSVAERYRNK